MRERLVREAKLTGKACKDNTTEAYSLSRTGSDILSHYLTNQYKKIMKVLILILLFMLTCCDRADGQLFQLSIVDGDVYIYEYAMKKPNQAHIGFVVISNDLIVKDICFTVNLSNGKIKNIFRREQVIVNILQYSKREDGNILIERNELLCYDSENFINRKKRISDSIYKMISISFLDMTNRERLKILNELSRSAEAVCLSRTYSSRLCLSS
jgi:hypothetical protein